METLTFDLPAMYGDHHVVEVRRLLMEMPGVEDIYASSGFQVLEVRYDPEKLDGEAIKAKLTEAGYLSDLGMPSESGIAAYSSDQRDTYFRHTAAYEQAGSVIGFAQKVNFSGRSLWPCPGMGVVQKMDEGRG